MITLFQHVHISFHTTFRAMISMSSTNIEIPFNPQGMNPLPSPPRRIINICSQKVHLNRCDNAWKPGVRRQHPTSDQGLQDTEELLKKFRSVLNKLTPEKFHRLVKQVLDLDINTEAKLEGVVDLLFQKAISEPGFANMYAELCCCLATLNIQSSEDSSTTVRFRSLLLRRCRLEFEKTSLDSATSSKDLDVDEAKARKRSLGNVRFIAELFKQKIISEAVILKCSEKLLNNGDDNSLECLCQLLTTAGKDIDSDQNQAQMTNFFRRVDTMIREKATSSRIRCLLLDVVDLRSNNWVSQKTNKGPRTIQEVHQEAKREEENSLKKAQQQLLCRNRDGAREQREREKREREQREREEMERLQREREQREKEEKERQQREREQKEREEMERKQRETEQREREQRKREEMKRQQREREKRERELREEMKRLQREREQRETEERERKQREREQREKEWRDRQQRERQQRKRKQKERKWREKEQSEIERRETQQRERDQMERKQKEREQREREQREKEERERQQREREQRERERRDREKKKKSPEDLIRELDRLLVDTSNEEIFGWVEKNLDESERSSSAFLRSLMTSVCRSAVISFDTKYFMDQSVMESRLPLLVRYLRSGSRQEELQALNALQALVVALGHPPHLLQFFFYWLAEEEIISDGAFVMWQSRKDPNEQQGKDIALKSTQAFFTCLREAAEEELTEQ